RGTTLHEHSLKNVEVELPVATYIVKEYEEQVSAVQRRRLLQTILEDNQCVNKAKSHFMIPTYAIMETIERIKEITGFFQQDSPITYLGYPLYIGGQRIIYYSDLVAKVVKRISGW
ncbi:hypothetical protein H5410_064677, partial [Solanum commersonii]